MDKYNPSSHAQVYTRKVRTYMLDLSNCIKPYIISLVKNYASN